MAEYIFEISDVLYDEETGEAVMKPIVKGELIRCKDCSHWSDENSISVGYCDVWDQYINNGEFFCACGCRRLNNGK